MYKPPLKHETIIVLCFRVLVVKIPATVLAIFSFPVVSFSTKFIHT